MTFFAKKLKKMKEKKQKLIFLTFFLLKNYFFRKKLFFLNFNFFPKEKIIIRDKNVLNLFFLHAKPIKLHISEILKSLTKILAWNLTF